jgi:hypothetical protein
MAPVPAAAAPTAQALLVALAGLPDTTAAEVAAAAGIGRSTASKLLATLAAQGRVLRRPGGSGRPWAAAGAAVSGARPRPGVHATGQLAIQWPSSRGMTMCPWNLYVLLG